MKMLTFLVLVVTNILLCQVAGEDYEETACLDCQQLLQKQNKIINQLSQKVRNLEATPRSGAEWTLAFRGTAYIGKSVYDAYKDGTGIPREVEPGCKQVTDPLPCKNHYRNSEVFDNWERVQEVAFILYSNYQKVKEILFDGTKTNYMTWFDKSKVKFSSWNQLKDTQTNIFSISGDIRVNLKRAFYINNLYNGCEDKGWFVALDMAYGSCPYEKIDRFPVFLYARHNQPENFNSGALDKADTMAIFVKYYSTP
ncbi:uncharacterized protein LOC131936531 [Physella acuta]|uniref:uncharacterized protein LOC131936531 n=1 Tax=Physella acuta TaxID=109671 RepID=UPI0027DC6788|nr:uncharacterized protein LOC131936531 [Physella acuta]